MLDNRNILSSMLSKRNLREDVSAGLKKHDACHKKTDIKVFVVVIPKEELAGWCPANASLGLTSTIKYYSTSFIDYIL